MDRFDFIPFSFLSLAEREQLRPDLHEVRYSDGEVIFAQGDRSDDRLFLLLEGTVEMRSPDRGGKREGVVEPGHYFGERPALFDEPRRYEARADGEVVCYALDGDRFLALVERSPLFARALGNILREKQGIFLAFDRFMAELLHGASIGRMDFPALVGRYKALKPAIHPFVSDWSKIDFGALSYALRRLPKNVGQSLVWFLADELPVLYSAPDESFTPIETDGRRRAVYEMMPGKNLVLLRDGLSDLIDLITCMCLLAVESRKIRKRLEDPEHLRALTTFLAGNGRRPELKLLRGLPLSPEEVEGLRGLWPGHTAERLRALALHHEDYNITVWKRIGIHNSSHADIWTAQLAEATEELLGFAPQALPEACRVHIISSNTHSVTNCLSTWLVQRTGAILDWGQQVSHPLMAYPWPNRQDRAIGLLRDYMKAHPEEAARRCALDEHEAMLELDETAFTGIKVQLFETSGLCLRPIDPALEPPPAQSRALIVNIDYAFGQQAEEIIANLIRLFGRNLDSINVLGKAGGLRGQRGDVLLPTAFLQQTDDHFQPLHCEIDLGRLQETLGERAIHEGPVLTVGGTLLQNRVMLGFYRHIWRCVGLEMEGSYYHRPLMEAQALGLLRPDLVTRYLYYVSDLPLDTEANLSGAMHASEGIPPLYAVTREILSGIFDQERARI